MDFVWFKSNKSSSTNHKHFQAWVGLRLDSNLFLMWHDLHSMMKVNFWQMQHLHLLKYDLKSNAIKVSLFNMWLRKSNITYCIPRFITGAWIFTLAQNRIHRDHTFHSHSLGERLIPSDPSLLLPTRRCKCIYIKLKTLFVRSWGVFNSLSLKCSVKR